MKTKVFPLVAVILLLSAGWSVSHAVTTAISPTTAAGDLHTTVTHSSPTGLCSGGCVITGGTRVGTNLFHSFGLFSIGTGDTATFQNTQVNGVFPLTSNILSRVTGGQPSQIFGTLRTADFGNANLFLINPAGVVFGPSASLNIGGSFHVSTADYLKMADGSLFIANPNFENSVNSDGSVNTTVLSSAAPQAFGFLSSNPAAIAFDNSFLSVPVAQTLSVVGGNITVTGGSLSAPSGQINLVSVASPGEVLLSSMQTAPNVNGDVFAAMGTINLSTGATLDVSGDAAGTVVIRGGQFVIDNATISADTGNTNGAVTAIDIDVTGDISISSQTGPALTARTSGSGDAGEVRISSANFTSSSSTANTFFALIDTHTSGAGKGGSVNLTTGDLTVSDDPFAPGFFIDSGTGGQGNGGNVTITAGKAQFTSTGIITGDAIDGGLGSGGNLTIKADSLKLTTVSFATDSFNARAGDFSLEATGNIEITGNSFLSNISLLGESTFTIKADRFALAGFSNILGGTALGPGGGITITAKAVEVTNGSPIATQTFGDGDSGNIRVTATDHITLSDGPPFGFQPSGFFTNSFGNAGLGTAGKAGAVEITTPLLTMTGGARINSTTQTNGQGGDVTIAAQSVSISGERPSEFAPEIFGLGSTRASGIYTRTVGSEFCTGPCGDAGRVSITTKSLSLASGGVLDSGTTNTGRGGAITIHATDTISISGTLSNGTPSGIFSRTTGTDPGSGSGGTIQLSAPQVVVTNGASVSAKSTGTGPAGNISIGKDAPVDSLVMQNSSITTESAQSGGGSIEIHAGRLVELTDSQITTSVQGGLGNGGNITIDPQVVSLQNSQIIANAFGGNGGNISIVAGVFLVDPTSTISASSTFGLSGTVEIQATVSNLSESVAPLSGEFGQAAALLPARCAARFNQSSLVLAGRDGVPLEPGGLLPSPLYGASQGIAGPSVSLDVPGLRVGRAWGDSHVTLVALETGCAS